MRKLRNASLTIIGLVIVSMLLAACGGDGRPNYPVQSASAQEGGGAVIGPGNAGPVGSGQVAQAQPTAAPAAATQVPATKPASTSAPAVQPTAAPSATPVVLPPTPTQAPPEPNRMSLTSTCEDSEPTAQGLYIQSGERRNCTFSFENVPSDWVLAGDGISIEVNGKRFNNAIFGMANLGGKVSGKIVNGAIQFGPPQAAFERYCGQVQWAREVPLALGNRHPLPGWECPK